MTDAALFGFGCAVLFVFLAGGYVLSRANFTALGASAPISSKSPQARGS